MDPLGGAQPIYNENRSAAIVANGEIYNFPAIAQQLTQQHQFATTSDSEAILHLFEEHGCRVVTQRWRACLPLPSKPAMISFWRVTRSASSHSIMGNSKTDGKHFYFASEMKALADWADEIHEFPPGHYLRFAAGFVQYYSVPTAPRWNGHLPSRSNWCAKSLEAAVASHLMSDVPVGAFLSGGLDSSVIAAMARKHVRELHTFSVGR